MQCYACAYGHDIAKKKTSNSVIDDNSFHYDMFNRRLLRLENQLILICLLRQNYIAHEQ